MCDDQEHQIDTVAYWIINIVEYIIYLSFSVL